MGYLARVAAKGAVKGYRVYKASENGAIFDARKGATGAFKGPPKQRGAIGDLRKDPGSRGKLKSRDALKRHNNVARDAARAVGLNKRQQQKLHREISHEGLSYHEIVEVAKDIKAGRL